MRLPRSIIVLALLGAGACSNMKDINALGGALSKPGLGIENPIKTGKGGLMKDVNLSRAIGAAGDLAKAATITESDVQAMSLQFSKYSDSKNKVAPASSRHAKRLKRLTSKHTREDGLNLNYKVYMNPAVNAFATADGSIRVFSGLMDKMRDQELLAVIGHEIGHVKLKHSYDKARSAMVTSAARKGVASLDSKVGALAASELGGLFEGAINSKFSRSAEHESDTYGLHFLLKHGYDGQGAVNAMYKLASLERDGGKSGASFLSSHPGPRERAKRLAAILKDAKKDPSMLKKMVAENKASASEDTSASREITKGKSVMNSASTASVAAARTKSATLASSMSKNNSGVNVEAVMSGKSMGTQNVGRVNRDSIDSGWYLQISAETDEQLADRKVELLRSEGLRVQTQRAVVRGEVYVRVLVGPYPNKYTAKSKVNQVKTAGVNDGEPFVRNIR